MNEQEATEALWAARQEDMGVANPASKPGPEQVEVTPPVATPDAAQGTTEESDSFTNYAPDDLPPELRPYYDSMLADYRRKTQDVAAQRQQFEELGGFETAREAVEFATQLQTDPEYALQVYNGLKSALEAAGMSVEQASVEAGRQVQAAAAGGGDEWDESLEDWDEGPDLTPIQNELQELRQWRDQFEQEREIEQFAFDLQKQEAAIQQGHPEYTEEDIESIYNLAWHTGGDLIKAEEEFRGMNQRLIERYLSQKAQVPSGVTPPSATGHAEIPDKAMTLDEAHEAAVAYLQNVVDESGS